MTKIEGVVNANLAAIVALEFFTFEGLKQVSCEVDTGFTGTIMIPRELVSKYQLPIDGQEYFKAVEDTNF